MDVTPQDGRALAAHRVSGGRRPPASRCRKRPAQPWVRRLAASAAQPASQRKLVVSPSPLAPSPAPSHYLNPHPAFSILSLVSALACSPSPAPPRLPPTQVPV